MLGLEPQFVLYLDKQYKGHFIQWTVSSGDFMNAYSLYEDVTDMTALRSHIEKQMKEHNSSPGVVRLDLVLFRDAVEHVCRIVRVISQPRGNVLLVGVGMFIYF